MSKKLIIFSPHTMKWELVPENWLDIFNAMVCRPQKVNPLPRCKKCHNRTRFSEILVGHFPWQDTCKTCAKEKLQEEFNAMVPAGFGV